MKVVILNSSIYILYFLFLLYAKKKGSNRLFSNNSFVHDKLVLYLLQISGIVLFCLVPVLSFQTSPPFISNNSFGINPLLVTVLFICMLLIVAPRLAIKSIKSYIRTNSVPVFDRYFLFLFFIIRTLFIASYELWFRGFLLIGLLQFFNWTLAIAINVALYSLMHLPNGRQEAVASIPFGLIICMMSLWSNSVLPAILIHLALTIGYEAGFIYHLKKEKLNDESISNRSIGIPG